MLFLDWKVNLTHTDTSTTVISCTLLCWWQYFIVPFSGCFVIPCLVFLQWLLHSCYFLEPGVYRKQPHCILVSFSHEEGESLHFSRTPSCIILWRRRHWSTKWFEFNRFNYCFNCEAWYIQFLADKKHKWISEACWGRKLLSPWWPW